MLRLLGLVAKGWPLPFGAVDNRRSFVGVDNLAAFLELCAVHPAAAGEIFLVSDEHDVSTPELMTTIARGLRQPLSMPGVPPAALRTMAGIARRGAELERLIGNLQVDARRARERLGWQPPVSFEQGVAAMTQWYREAMRR
jgi:nucleoside-diphosphate-sugar epimerase